MVCIADVQKTYAMVVGAVLVLLGLVGFVNAPILGIFGVNLAQNLLHLVGGGIIIWQAGKKTNMWTGVIALVVGLLWFAEGLDGGLLASIFAINAAISYLHVAVGVVSLGVAYGVKEGTA